MNPLHTSFTLHNLAGCIRAPADNHLPYFESLTHTPFLFSYLNLFGFHSNSLNIRVPSADTATCPWKKNKQYC